MKIVWKIKLIRQTILFNSVTKVWKLNIEYWDTLIDSIFGQIVDYFETSVQKYPSLAVTNI